MAKLTSILKINGSVDGLTIYHLPGVEQPVVRRTWGARKEDIRTKAAYAVTRRNISETCGRGKAVAWLMKAFQPLKPLADYDTAGQLQRLLRAVQKGDTVSDYGKRAVHFSQHASLLEGFCLTKALPFDAVVHGDVFAEVHKEALEASVQWPDLLPGLTFFPPKEYPYCRLVATLGVAPDVLYSAAGYTTDGDYGNCYALGVTTDWFAARAGLPATTLSLALPYTPPSAAFALVLSVGVQLGLPGPTGAIEPVRKRVGSAKILAVT